MNEVQFTIPDTKLGHIVATALHNSDVPFKTSLDSQGAFTFYFLDTQLARLEAQLADTFNMRILERITYEYGLAMLNGKPWGFTDTTEKTFLQHGFYFEDAPFNTRRRNYVSVQRGGREIYRAYQGD